MLVAIYSNQLSKNAMELSGFEPPDLLRAM